MRNNPIVLALVLEALLAAGCQIRSIGTANRPCEADGSCAAGNACDTTKNLCVKAETLCIDADTDGYGTGPACRAPDCDDAVASCNSDCTTDSDADGLRDCDDPCVDADTDGYGTGPSCAGPDCDDAVAACAASCADLDADGLRDCDVDTCVDVDGEGLGRAGFTNTSCVSAAFDSDDNDAHHCADSDHDGCDDCSSGVFAPRADGTDVDGDGFCAASDCDDNDPTVYPGRVELCDGKDNNCNGATDEGLTFVTYYRDSDADGFGNPSTSLSACGPVAGYVTNGLDCDDTIPDCTSDCVSNGDLVAEVAAGETPVSDCVEQYCGSDPPGGPADGNLSCIRVASTSEWNAAAVLANGATGSKRYSILLGEFTTTAKLDALTNATVQVHVKQEAGKVVVANFAVLDGPLFSLAGTNVKFGPAHVVADSNVQTVLEVSNSLNAINDVVIEGSPAVGIAITASGGTNTLTSVHVAGASATGISIAGTGNTIVTSSVSGASATGISIAGGSNTVTSATITNFAGTGVHVHGASGGATVTRSIISGGTGSTAAGILVTDSGTLQLVQNVIANNAGHGVQLNGASGCYVDQNTVANNGGDGLSFVLNPSVGPCIRNNDVSGNAGYAIAFDNSIGLPSWNPLAACKSPLNTSGSGKAYGNNSYGNTLGDCFSAGAACDCVSTCYPAGSFWQFAASPDFVSIALGQPTYFCMNPSNAALVDQGKDLGYDLNGTDAGFFNGSAPDIGGRESGSGGCPL